MKIGLFLFSEIQVNIKILMRLCFSIYILTAFFLGMPNAQAESPDEKFIFRQGCAFERYDEEGCTACSSLAIAEIKRHGKSNVFWRTYERCSQYSCMPLGKSGICGTCTRGGADDWCIPSTFKPIKSPESRHNKQGS